MDLRLHPNSVSLRDHEGEEANEEAAQEAESDPRHASVNVQEGDIENTAMQSERALRH